MTLTKYLKIYLLPPEHGGWFLFLGPFLLGALVAARPNLDLLILLCLSLAAFIARQPLTISVKALSGRRARSDLAPALYALGAIGVVVAVLFSFLVWRGHLYLLWLGLAALPVLVWQMILVTSRQERQLGIELVGTGALSLTAPAAYWVSLGTYDARGWWLWALSWLYAASAIVYVYMRLNQRRLTTMPSWNERWRAGLRVLLYAGVSLLLVSLGSLFGLFTSLAPIPFALALIHFIYGIARPAVGARPVQIGTEQSVATLLFYILSGLTLRG